MLWWVELGYHPFTEGPDGYPLAGEVVKHYREEKTNEKGQKMTQADLARRLDVNRRTVLRIEKGQESLSKERREFLCGLLGIPPALIGLVPISTITEQLKQKWGQSPAGSGNIGSKSIIDIEDHQTFLGKAKDLQRFTSASGILSIVETRTTEVYLSLPHSNSNMHQQLHRLLWEYHIFMAQTWQRKGEWGNAILQLDKAMLFANSLEDDELRTICLLRSGMVHRYSGNVQESINAFGNASRYDKKVSSYLTGVRLIYSAPVHAKAMRMGMNISGGAMSIIEDGGNMVRAIPSQIYEFGFDFSVQAYHLNRGETLMNSGYPRDALNEFAFVQSDPVSWWRARQNMLEAQAYANSGNLVMSVSYAESALDLIRAFKSDDFHHIQSVYRQLRQSRHGKHKDVDRLERKLLQIQ